MVLPVLDLARRSEHPVYRQIAEQIRRAIERGELAEGERLPAIRSLARQLSLNRDTVALAYEALASDGRVESLVGRGTFVRRSIEGPPARLDAPIPLARPVERLLGIESTRPRFGADTDVVSLHSLVPDPAFYPVDEFRRVLNRVLAEGGPDLFLYGVPQGHPGLREVLAERFRSAGMVVERDDVVLCHGASQGISLALRLFAEAGDSIAIEMPTYHNALAALAALGLEPAPVPMFEGAPELAALDRTLARPEVKAFYTIPTFHNPMGSTTSLAHRRALLEIAARHGVPVIEDAFEMDLRFAGRGVAPLAALDPGGLVVHLFSFSKSLFPGARVGSIVTRGRPLEGLLALKHSSDLSDSMPLQAAMAEFVRSGAYDRHLGRIRRILRSRRDALLAALADELPPGTRWTTPEGGYQVWVELPVALDTRDLLAHAARAGVLFAPGSQFMCDQRASRCLRLTIARADEDEIRRGVAALGRVLRESLDADPLAREGASAHL